MKFGATTNRRKKKSALITAGVHLAILVLGLIPLASSVQRVEEDFYSIPIEFAEFAQSSHEGAKATSDVLIEQTKPVVEEETPEAEITEYSEEDISEIEPVAEIDTPSDITEEQQEVTSTDAVQETHDTPPSSSDGGQMATAEQGEPGGADSAGENDGNKGLDGDGVITRMIVHREDIAAAAIESGIIVVDVCIDRAGKILTAKNNASLTTIDNMDMVRHAMGIAASYRFETDYSAALRECGSLTFVFDIETDTDRITLQNPGVYVVND